MANVYTVNGLSEETGIDRRTVKARLRDIPPTAKKGRFDAWRLSEVLPFLMQESRPLGVSGGDRLMEHFLDRVMNWREIEANHKTADARKWFPDAKVVDGLVVFTLEHIARMLQAESADVLVWTRAGLPFARKGNPTDGAGYLFYLPAVIDWTILVHRAVWIAERNGQRAPDGREYRDILRLRFLN